MGGGSGFTGLGGAFLGAHARGVVGSLWRVDDRLTAQLMTRFYKNYGTRGDAPRALRDAQLDMIHSGDPELVSPAAWAGFEYAGR
jgi:CHAT domain-containing protein